MEEKKIDKINSVLSGGGMAQMSSKLSNEIVADTQIIEAVVDRTIFVVRAGLLDRTMIPELEGMAERQQIKQISLVLNGTEPVGHYYGYRYGYSYGYRYGYHYGYGSSKGDDYYTSK